MDAHRGHGPTSTAVMAAATDHVRLGYHYLNTGDLDGYASLLDPMAEVRDPGHRPPVRGRERVVRWWAENVADQRVHEVLEVFGHHDRVAVTGRLLGPASGARRDVGFADVFQVSEIGLLLTQTRYYFTDPG